ncbi:MAG: hypothetical protein JWQ03_3240 [Variovorax sp.]|nr:hypothetical protein [Variovorax sp.]
MTVVVITPPAALPVTLAQAKANLRVDNTDEDAYITSLIEAVSENLDGPDGILGRALITQTLELRLSAFPPAAGSWKDDRIWRGGASADAWPHDFHLDVPLPFPPVASITSVKFYDSTGADLTLSSSAYQTLGSRGRQRLALTPDQSWPDAPWRREGIRIRYVAGYGEDDTFVPAPIRHAILLKVGTLYANRESVLIERATALELPQSAQALLAPYRISAF